jgi:hypothetical protein
MNHKSCRYCGVVTKFETHEKSCHCNPMNSSKCKKGNTICACGSQYQDNPKSIVSHSRSKRHQDHLARIAPLSVVAIPIADDNENLPADDDLNVPVDDNGKLPADDDRKFHASCADMSAMLDRGSTCVAPVTAPATGSVIDQGLAAMLADGSLRVDQATNMISVIDIVCAITGKSSDISSKIIRRLFEGNQDVRTKCPELRINKKGKLTPVCNAATAMEIVWLLPGKAAKEVRRHHAHQICRILGGDPTLITEMELRYMHTPEEQRQVFLQDVDPCPAMENEEFKARTEKRQRELDVERNQNAKIARISDIELEMMECKLQTARHDMAARNASTTLTAMQQFHLAFTAGPLSDPRMAQQARDYANNTCMAFIAPLSASSFDARDENSAVNLRDPNLGLATVAKIIECHLIAQGRSPSEAIAAIKNGVTSNVGKRSKRLFLVKYGTVNIETVKKFVNGEDRHVAVYKPEDHHLVLTAYNEYLIEVESKIRA